MSSLAIRHVSENRKRALFSDSGIHAALNPVGIFSNLEHVALVSAEPQRRFLRALRTNGCSSPLQVPRHQRAGDIALTKSDRLRHSVNAATVPKRPPRRTVH